METEQAVPAGKKITATQAVLLVDDDERLLASIVRSLGRKFDLATASGGPQALAMLDSGRRFAVLVSDLAMPGLDGITLLDRTRRAFPDMVRIMLTGTAGRDRLIQAINSGYLFRFLEKPVSNELLAQAIEDGLTQHRRVWAEKELFFLERHKKALDGVLNSFVKLMEARDPYTAGHQAQVAKLAGAIAHEMGLSRERVEATVMAATIHDIGKMYVPAEFLNRPGALSAVEFRVVKEHPAVGWSVLKEVEFEHPVAEYVYQHHERLNGKGYPQGLSGGQIHLESGIIAVADVVEAMSSHRPYRPALGLAQAMAEIQRGAGELYAPRVVKACQAVIDRGIWGLEEPSSSPWDAHRDKATRLDSV